MMLSDEVLISWKRRGQKGTENRTCHWEAPPRGNRPSHAPTDVPGHETGCHGQVERTVKTNGRVRMDDWRATVTQTQGDTGDKQGRGALGQAFTAQRVSAFRKTRGAAAARSVAKAVSRAQGLAARRVGARLGYGGRAAAHRTSLGCAVRPRGGLTLQPDPMDPPPDTPHCPSQHQRHLQEPRVWSQTLGMS